MMIKILIYLPLSYLFFQTLTSHAHPTKSNDCEPVDYRISTEVVARHGPINRQTFDKLTCIKKNITPLESDKTQHKNNNWTQLKPTSIVINDGRYGKQKPQANYFQHNPLQLTFSGSIPSNVKSIGDAIAFMLQKTGYSVAKPNRGPYLNQYVLFHYPLPSIQRHFKQVQISEILSVFAGKAFDVFIDDVNRQISFKLKTKYQGLLSHEKSQRARKLWFKRSNLQNEKSK